MSNPLDSTVDEVYRLSATKPILFDTEGDKEYNIPKLVSELKPVGVIDTKGRLIGVRFQNFIGDDINVMALSDIMPNVRIYQGVKNGLLPVIDAATVDASPDRVHYIAIPVLAQDFMTNLPAGHRKVGMQLRAVKKNEDSNGYTPLKLRKGGLERAVIVVPGSMPLFSGGKKNEMISIILEEIPVGHASAEPSGLVRMMLL